MVDELVQVRQRYDIPFQQLGAFLGLAQFKPRAAQYYFAAMLDVALDDFLEVERLRTAMINRERVDAERNLELGVLKQFGDDHLRIRIALELDHETANVRRTHYASRKFP